MAKLGWSASRLKVVPIKTSPLAERPERLQGQILTEAQKPYKP
jgi:hypothetical protein